MNKGQIKTFALTILFFIILSILIYAVSTTLSSPASNAVDTDSYLDLRAECITSSYANPTSFNITNATLYFDGVRNKTIQLTPSQIIGNSTFLFNFTNVINFTAEGDHRWQVECNEVNGTKDGTDGINISKTLSENRTIRVIYALSTLTINSPSPDDGVYSIRGSLNFSFAAQASPPAGWNISSFDFFTNATGTWSRNETNIPLAATVGTTVFSNFSNLSRYNLPDGTRIVWAFGANQTLNDTSGDGTLSKYVFTPNRTIKIEYPPNITILNPVTSNWSKTRQVSINFSISSNYTSSPNYDCVLFSNETGIWTSHSGGFAGKNGTNVLSATFQEKTSINYAFRCAENAEQNAVNFSINNTINIDTINPTVTTTVTNGTIFNQSIRITFTPTDANLDAVIIRSNFNSTGYGSFFNNYTNTSPVSGEAHTVEFDGIIDGNFNFSIFVNDSSGRTFQTANFTVIVDMTRPRIINIQNFTVDGYCDRINLTWDTNESTNFTILIGTNSENMSTSYSNSSKQFNNSYILNFGLEGERTFFFNITSCDAANNCNNSAQYQFIVPARVCTGWNYYSIYDAAINFSTLQNQSGADLLYVWNSTRQSWVFMTNGLSTSINTIVGKTTHYHAILLFENTNSTWRRNLTNPGYYEYNITAGDNFVSIPTDYTFGNLTESFMNASRIYPSTIGNITGDNNVPLDSIYGPWNITNFAGFNNSNQKWVSHLFNFTWANLTVLSPTPATSKIEVTWFYSDYNVTWNGTEVYGNWTKYTR